jgi:hypothetical protein
MAAAHLAHRVHPALETAESAIMNSGHATVHIRSMHHIGISVMRHMNVVRMHGCVAMA